MLSSCLNLAGCNSISYEAGKQSRQVLRRRFGVISADSQKETYGSNTAAHGTYMRVP